MRAPVSHRFVRLLVGMGLAGALLLPALAAPARAAEEPLVLRVGTVQDLDSANPYQTLLVVGYEVFQLTYNLLVDFGPNLEPVPGFAESWERAADGKSWTFKFRDGLKWSDGTPATAQDACYSWQLAVDGDRRRVEHRRRLPRPRPRRRRRHEGRVPRRHDDDRVHGGRLRPDPPDVPADRPEAHLGRARLHRDRRGQVRGAARRHRPVHARRVADQPVRPLRAQPRVLGHAGRSRRDRHRLLQERRHDGAGAQGGRDRLRPQPQLRAAEGARSPSRA